MCYSFSIHCVLYVYIKSFLNTTIASLQRFISKGCALISLVKTINAAITFETTAHLYELNSFTHYLVVYDKT